MDDPTWSSSPSAAEYECDEDGADFATVKASKVAKLSSSKTTSKAKTLNRSKLSRSRGNKSSRTSPTTLPWLEDNYEISEGVCLPRSVLYNHYQDYCKRSSIDPVGAASFGKVIRQKFPNITTRRLGTRGQSKYHYYGIGIKETSIYYRSAYSTRVLTRFSGANTSKREGSQSFLPSKTGILLTGFPKVKELTLSETFPVQKMETFMIMYQTHCQRILDTVVRANFEEVQGFFIHFWQGMPTHMLPILGCQSTINLITVCDCILYKTLGETLIPSSLQPLPESLAEDLKNFSINITEWLLDALEDLPAQLGIRKMHVADLFGRNLRRQLSLVQMTQATRNVLRSSEQVNDMLGDWRELNFVEISKHSVFIAQQHASPESDLTREVALEMEQLFVKQSPLEVYFEWLDSVIEKRVCNMQLQGFDTQMLCQNFLLFWNYFVSRAEREMTLNSASSFGSFRMLLMLLNEYVMYVLEMLQQQDTETQYEAMLMRPKEVTGESSPSSSSADHPSLMIPHQVPVIKLLQQQPRPGYYCPPPPLDRPSPLHPIAPPSALAVQPIKEEYIITTHRMDNAYPPVHPYSDHVSPSNSLSSPTDFFIPPTPQSLHLSHCSDRSQSLSPLDTCPSSSSSSDDSCSPTASGCRSMFSAPHDPNFTPAMHGDQQHTTEGDPSRTMLPDMDYEPTYFNQQPFMELSDVFPDSVFNYGYEWNTCTMDTTGHFLESLPSQFLQSPIPIA